MSSEPGPLPFIQELVLVRLPSALAQAVGGSNGAAAVEMGQGTMPPAAFADVAAVKVLAEPAVQAALSEVLRRALLEADPDARATLDGVADELRGRLRSRLQAGGLPETAAEALQTPW